MRQCRVDGITEENDSRGIAFSAQLVPFVGWFARIQRLLHQLTIRRLSAESSDDVLHCRAPIFDVFLQVIDIRPSHPVLRSPFVETLAHEPNDACLGCLCLVIPDR
jgi:hypothetical protein